MLVSTLPAHGTGLNDCQAGPPGFRIGEELMLRLKLQYFGHLMQRTDSLGKNPDAGKDRRQEEKGTTEDKMVEWHH